jgi:hypothetical protein
MGGEGRLSTGTGTQGHGIWQVAGAGWEQLLALLDGGWGRGRARGGRESGEGAREVAALQLEVGLASALLGGRPAGLAGAAVEKVFGAVEYAVDKEGEVSFQEGAPVALDVL